MSDFTSICNRLQNAIIKKDTNIIEVEKIIENHFSSESSKKLLEDNILFVTIDKPGHGYFISPAELALSVKNLKALELIVRGCGNPNIKIKYDELEITLMMRAVMNGDLAAVELLLSLGAEPNYSTEHEKTQEITALTISLMEKNYLISQKLLSAGALFSFLDAWTFVNNESELFDFVIEELRKNPTLIEARDMDSNATLLHIACGKGKLSTSQWLIENGADINALGNDNITPLFYAILSQNIEIVKLLVESGADLNASMKDKGNDSATLLFFAIDSQNIEIVKLLVDSGADINKASLRDNDNVTPLYLAVDLENIEIVKFLVDSGADINASLSDNDNVTPLFLAIKSQNIEIVKLLVESGADINIIIDGDITPFMYAVNMGSYDIAEYLKLKGAHTTDLNVKEEQSIITNITDLIERFELLEDKFQIRIEGVYGVVSEYSSLSSKEYSVEVNFDVIGSADAFAEDGGLYFIFNAYNTSGQLIATNTRLINSDKFIGIESVKIRLDCLEKPTRFRLYPRGF